MNDQRMVDVGLLNDLETLVRFAANTMNADHQRNHAKNLQLKLKAIIDGPGVEPVAATLQAFADFLHSIPDDEDGYQWGPVRVKYSSDGSRLIDGPWWATQEETRQWATMFMALYPDLAAPSAPVQAVPDVWLEQYDIFTKDYRRYVAGDTTMPFSVLRMSLAAFLEECEKIAAAPQPPKESTAQSVACPTDKEK